LLIVFPWRGALTQIWQNLDDEEKMRAADQERDQCHYSRVGSRMQTIEKSAAAPGEQNSKNNGSAHKFDKQDGSQGRQPSLVLRALVPATPEEASCESRNDPHR